MKKQHYWLLLIISILQMMNFVCVNCHPVAASNLHTSLFQLQHKMHSPQEGKKSMMEEEREKELYKEGKKMIGSRPPSCVNRCYECMPCEHIQVPTNSNTVGVQYANYFPEGWKCKCGITFYTP